MHHRVGSNTDFATREAAMNLPQVEESAPVSAPCPQLVAELPLYDSDQLFGAGKEIFIRHGGELYRLRITRHAKLILTK